MRDKEFDGEYVDVRPLAKELNLSPAVLYDGIKKKKFPHYRLGRRVWLHRTELLAALKVMPKGRVK